MTTQVWMSNYFVLMEMTHVFSSLHLTPKNPLRVRKMEPKYAKM